MKSIFSLLMVIMVLLFTTTGFAQLKNAQTSTVNISGNCNMCKNTIENAGNVKNEAQVTWNSETQSATLTYNSEKTNPDEILKRIALAGYDNEQYLAPDEVYAQLPGCCQYNRVLNPALDGGHATAEAVNEHHHHAHEAETVQVQESSQLATVFDHYFLLKDALVKSEAHTAMSKAYDLSERIKEVAIDKLSTQEHPVWMDVTEDIAAAAKEIAGTQDIAKQRSAFALLSDQLYRLAKVSQSKTTMYYQHCPMYNNNKGGNWLSKDSAVKNPYYGTQMLTCGNTVETLE